jgi:two-component sensor histidine kinase
MGHSDARRAETDAEAGLGPTGLRIAEGDHRVANSLSLTAALLRMQREQSADDAVRSAILTAEARVASIAKFHAYLHRHGSSERVDLTDLFREVLPEMGAAIGIRCLLAIKASVRLDVPGRVARQLVIIVNELALNALKHGYGGREGGCLSLELDLEGGMLLKLKVADGGTGLPDGFDAGNGGGLGLRIVSSLVRELGGSLSSYTDGGAHFTIAIPAG